VERPLIGWAEVTLDYCDTERAANFWSAVLDLPARTQSQEGWFQLGPTVVGGPVVTRYLSNTSMTVSGINPESFCVSAIRADAP
jgi:hypothetical protein